MPSKRFDENTKGTAFRLVREHADDYDSEWAAMCAISARLGMTAETPRGSGCAKSRGRPRSPGTAPKGRTAAAPPLNSPSATGSTESATGARHSAIGMISPAEYENRCTQTAQAA